MDIVRVRLHPQTLLLYKAQADSNNLPLGTYLRQRLEEQDRTLEQLHTFEERLRHLEQGIQDLINLVTTETKVPSSKDDSLLIEILLLLRSASTPSRLRMIHAELEQQGLTVWDEIQEPSP